MKELLGGYADGQIAMYEKSIQGQLYIISSFPLLFILLRVLCVYIHADVLALSKSK